MSASLSPGISSPFLMRRINRMGLISGPTFSRRPRIKAITFISSNKARTKERLTRSTFRILQQVLPQIVICLFFGEFDSLKYKSIHIVDEIKRTDLPNVAESFDNERQRLLVISHAPKQVHHFGDQILVLTDSIRLTFESMLGDDVYEYLAYPLQAVICTSA